MERAEARRQLFELVKIPGALRVITNRCRPEQSCSEEGHTNIPYPPTNPEHFVIHDVVRIERHPTGADILVAFTEEDYCLGYPENLLPRLLEAGGGWGWASPPLEEVIRSPEAPISGVFKGWWRRLFG